MYFECLQSAVTLWRDQLTHCELGVLVTVIERTLRYKKEYEVIPIRHFLEGVYTSDGKKVLAGLSFRKASIIKAYQRLTEIGLVYIKKVPGTVRNMFAVNVEFLLEEAYKMAGKLKETRHNKKSNTVTEGTSRGHSGNQWGSLREPVYNKTLIRRHDTNIQLRPATPDVEGVGISLKEIIEKAKEKNLHSLQRKSTKGITPEGLKSTWKLTMVEMFGKISEPAITNKDAIILKQNVAKCHITIPIDDFIKWSITHWEDIRKNELSWAVKRNSSFTEVPSFKEFAYLFSYFVKAYSQQEYREVAHQKLQSTANTKITRNLDTSIIDDLENQLIEEKQRTAKLERFISDTIDKSKKYFSLDTDNKIDPKKVLPI